MNTVNFKVRELGDLSVHFGYKEHLEPKNLSL